LGRTQEEKEALRKGEKKRGIKVTEVVARKSSSANQEAS